MLKTSLHLLSSLGLAALIAVTLMLPLTGLTYADDPLIVNSTGDGSDADINDDKCETINAGECTLRAAIEQSNADATITHTIQFSIAGSGPHTIAPAAALPDITHPVIIDGLTQPDASCDSPQVEINGMNVPAIVDLGALPNPSALTPPIGLNLTAGNSTVRGLVINNFDDAAIVPGLGTFIDDVGIAISIDNSDNNTIECNFLGTEPNGTTAAPNQVGVSVGNGNDNVITGNLISGNGNGGSQTAGIIIAVEPVNGGESSNNRIINNRIGTDKTGELDRGNEQDGVLLVNAKNTVISGNLISGNGDDGVDITDVAQISFQGLDFSVACDAAPCAAGNVIQNNSIGLTVSGGMLGNGNDGVEIKNAEQNLVYSNTIAHNAYQGVEINELTPAADACTKVSTPCTLSNTISANSIYANTQLGIDLTANSAGGVTLNDSDDSDDGANRLQNYPVLLNALTSATSLHVSGVLTAAADSTFTVELFANDTCDPSGHGEGQTFLMSDTVTTNGSGVATFLAKTTRPTGQHIVATATGSGGNSSEFSECVTISGAASILYVDTEATGAATGLSWTDAFTNLQDALAIAGSGQEIWVAEGVYYPDEGAGQIAGSVTATFQLVAGVEIYGGFAATEAVRTERDWTANPTVLSGDLGGDDITDANGVVTTTDHVSGANSYHVVWADGVSSPITESTALDGFTITAGQALGSDPHSDGGGFYCDSEGTGSECSPTLSNLTFSGNWADNDGGAMFNYAASDGVSSPSLSDVTFSGNGSGDDGGAMGNEGRDGGICSPSLVNVTFSGNETADSGGAMYNYGLFGGVSSPSLSNVTFSGNETADSGGAMYNYGLFGGVSNPSLVNVIFSGNVAADKGGAMSNFGDANGASSPSLSNVIFSGNTATFGGAIANYPRDGGVGSPNLVNVTFSDNSASSQGGAMYSRARSGGASYPSLSNVILWGNTAAAGAQIYNITTTLSISHSLIQSDTNAIFNDTDGSVAYGPNILTGDPLFVDEDGPDGIAGTLDDDLRLLPGSPAIDSGDNSSAPGQDINGVTRPVNGVVDMGAYESQGFSLTISGGNNQVTPTDTAFASPLQVTVSSGAGEPVGPGGIISFTAPVTGAGVTSPTLTAATGSSGVVSVTVTANSIEGTYTVTATATGASNNAIFTLANQYASEIYLPILMKDN